MLDRPLAARLTRGRTLVACLFVATAAFWALPAHSQSGGDAAGGGRLQLAHSALLVVDAGVEGESLTLRVRRVRDQSLVTTDDVSISVDGKSQTVTRGSDGSVLVPLSELRGGSRTVGMIVGHDGIREVLTGTVTLPDAGAPGLLGNHKQLAWWVLNIIIVLIAVTAISRRKS